jgi:hypothetical protein
MQFNCNGIGKKLQQIVHFMSAKNIMVAAIQETKLQRTSPKPSVDGYSILRKDRIAGDGGGGLMFIIADCAEITFRERDIQWTAPPNRHIEVHAVHLFINDKRLLLINSYIPPDSSCVEKAISVADLLDVQEESILFMGDVNAHHYGWDALGTPDDRGDDLMDEISASPMILLNDADTPTRAPSNGTCTSPDITLASPEVHRYSSWRTYTALGSDHLPIVVSIQLSPKRDPAPLKCYANYGKANWDGFRELTNRMFAGLPPPQSAHTGEREFRRLILVASKRCIPHGRHHPSRAHMPATVLPLIRERDRRRTVDPADPEVPALTAQINALVDQDKEAKWRELLESCDLRTESAKLWRTVKSLSGNAVKPVNAAISFGNLIATGPAVAARSFNKMFATVVQHQITKARKKATRKRVLTKNLADCPVITIDEVSKAIKRASNSKAIGPDGLNMLHLKNMGANAVRYLTRIMQLSLEHCNIPAIWKCSTIVPLPKPGKDVCDSKSYRPISLLAPGVKIMESVLLPTLNAHLAPNAHQHGFRPKHSTVTALLKLTNRIARGFNQNKPAHRTIVVALDLTKAFDSLDHCSLIDKVAATNLPGAVTRWLANYLHGRQCRTLFRGSTSRARTVKVGTPQGSVASPTLFSFYIADLPEPDPESGLQVVVYADDITIFGTGKIDEVTNALNEYLPRLHAYLQSLALHISAEKSTVTLLTPDSHEYNVHPAVSVDGKQLPLEHTPKILGVLFDTMFTFGPHCLRTAKRAQLRNNVLRALTSTSWGHSKETIIATFKAIGKSVLNYAAPVWIPNTKSTNVDHLQRVQNEALRIATGCHKMSCVDHIHHETKELPIQRHCDLLAAQFLAACAQQDHPCHEMYHDDPGPRKMKKTLKSHYLVKVEEASLVGVRREPDHRKVQNRLHGVYVAAELARQRPNRVLGRKAPAIDPAELKLPRKSRCRLAQLRSGFSICLRSYQHRINEQIPDICPKCRGSPHSVAHLFQCPANPALLQFDPPLTPEDLWLRPVECARAFNFDL